MLIPVVEVMAVISTGGKVRKGAMGISAGAGVGTGTGIGAGINVS
jgi:hypothetical protein